MNSVDFFDKKETIIKYGKYALILLVLIIIIISFRGCKKNYTSIETDMITAAKNYIADNNITVSNQTYIEIEKLGSVPGTEMCSKASGVIVKNENGVISYKPYLKCDNYETALNTEKYKYIILNGDDITVLNRGEIYKEPAYTLTADADVQISGAVGTTPGIYQIRYDVYIGNELKETAYRSVIVSTSDKDQNITGLRNREEPTLTLLGDTNIILRVGERYVEPGYTAIDYTDGKIGRRVVREPDQIDTSKEGRYEIIYSVTNSKGNTAIAKRVVTIVRNKANFDILLTKSTEQLSKSVNITVQIIGDGYDSIITPISTISRYATYTAKNNGTYKFVALDVYGNEHVKEIEVNNIDNIPPSGSCTALVQGSNTLVEVEADDTKGIAGYSYILDDNMPTDYTSESSYRMSIASEHVSVKVKDIAGNEATLTCEVTVKEDPTVEGRPSGSAEVIDTSEYRLVSTKNDVIEFAKIVDELNVAQTHPPKYSGYCLSFAYYHAYMLYNGSDLYSMNAPDGASYMYATKFKAFTDDDKQVVLEKIYELINEGQPMVLHVNGNKEGTSRHYVTVVGYKDSVTSGSTMTEEDLLIIDSYDGKLERMDRSESRFIISGYDTGRTGYGYQLYILR